jgi:hypothetical protein
MQNIINKNSIGKFHGYQEWYFKGKLSSRGVIKNDKRIGYTEIYDYNTTNFYIR